MRGPLGHGRSRSVTVVHGRLRSVTVGHGRSRSVTDPRPGAPAPRRAAPPWALACEGGGGGVRARRSPGANEPTAPPTPPQPTHPRLPRWGKAAPWWIGANRPAGPPASLRGSRGSEGGRRCTLHIAARADGRRAQSPASACEAPAARSRSEASHNLTDWPTRARETGRAAPAGGGRPAAGPRLRRTAEATDRKNNNYKKRCCCCCGGGGGGRVVLRRRRRRRRGGCGGSTRCRGAGGRSPAASAPPRPARMPPLRRRRNC